MLSLSRCSSNGICIGRSVVDISVFDVFPEAWLPLRLLVLVFLTESFRPSIERVFSVNDRLRDNDRSGIEDLLASAILAII